MPACALIGDLSCMFEPPLSSYLYMNIIKKQNREREENGNAARVPDFRVSLSRVVRANKACLKASIGAHFDDARERRISGPPYESR